ncbi:MAG: SprT family zinc-dependent metalloprotease [Motiliproteus sp.]
MPYKFECCPDAPVNSPGGAKVTAPQLSVPWQVKFTRRRGSIALQIGADQVKVLAPQGTAARTIHQLLVKRSDWIELKIDQQRHKQQQRPAFSRDYNSGERWLVDGQQCRLALQQDDTLIQPAIQLNNDQLVLQHTTEEEPDCALRAELIQRWYQQQAEQRWPQQLQHWAEITGLQPSGLKIRPYKSRWGSCNHRGLISLNTLLMMAPVATQDYVIIHELCHLQHPNHSANYWQLVRRYCTDPKQHRRWLKDHLRYLTF